MLLQAQVPEPVLPPERVPVQALLQVRAQVPVLPPERVPVQALLQVRAQVPVLLRASPVQRGGSGYTLLHAQVPPHTACHSM